MKSMKIMVLVIAGTLLMGVAQAAIVQTSDTFDNNTVTFANWVSVGSTATVIAYRPNSTNDYNDGNESTYTGYTVGMTLIGDGVYNDGGVRFNTQNGSPLDEAMGLTIGGSMQTGEQITFSGGLYNDNISAYSVYVQLWNNTDSTLLAEQAYSLLGQNKTNYFGKDFSVSYTALTSDNGDVLQIRFRENVTANTSDPYIDSFSVTSVIPEPATIGMLGLGALASLLLRRMKSV